ncbi:MAG: nucleotidyltransferase family protein [Holosporaceae bacterium]|jgi:NDP-sugar pyrophosphorylase family protein|nr:nucleotidyltransferase family protein [Holosporaceae bacterium]
MLSIAILAGGLATRMHPATEKIPKSLLLVAGEPFIFHQLKLLKERGISKVVLCVGHLGEMIEAQVGNGSQFGLEISYSFDGTELLGTAGALKKALPLLEETFFVLYGDSYLDCDYEAVYECHKQSKRSALITIYHNKCLYDNSNIIFRDKKIICYDKKHPVPEMQYIDYGLGILQKRLLGNLQSNKFYDLMDTYADLIKKNELASFVAKKRFYEIGSPHGLKQLSKLLQKKALFRRNLLG